MNISQKINSMNPFMKYRILFTLLSVVLLLSSCSVLKEQGSKRYLNVKVLQTLSKTEALVVPNSQYDTNVYKVITSNEMLYDGKVIRGWYVLIDTYTYVTVKDLQKTVPVYISLNDYRLLKGSNNQY